MKIKDYQLLFKAVVGSHSYGTNVEGSDVDYKGVYIQTPKDILYDGYIPQIEIGKDEAYYEIGRFLSLCEKANPTVLELLYTPIDCVVYKHPLFDRIIANGPRFLTKKCRLSFGGYAVEQIKKARGLEKKMNWEKNRVVRKDILDFCYVHINAESVPVKEFLRDTGLRQEQIGLTSIPHMKDCYALYSQLHKIAGFTPLGIAQNLEKSNDVSLTSIPKGYNTIGVPYVMYFNKDAYSSHCRDYNEYQKWLKNRNIQRYIDIKGHGQQIDGKNMLHCVRLIETALEIPNDKVINVRRPNPEYLIGIRKGEFNLKDLLDKCEDSIKELDRAFEESDLPSTVEQGFTKKLIISIREAYEQAE